jgi:hypothetical protein
MKHPAQLTYLGKELAHNRFVGEGDYQARASGERHIPLAKQGPVRVLLDIVRMLDGVELYVCHGPPVLGPRIPDNGHSFHDGEATEKIGYLRYE